MSVNKCKYSEKFRPLLTWMLQSGNSIEEFVQEHFIEDVDTILEKLGAQPSAPTSSKIVTVIDRDQILVKDVDEESKLLSILPGDLHDQVKHNVKADLVKSLIYDPTTSSVVDLNYNIQGHSGLNIKLFEYQAKLLNDLRSYLGEATIPLNVIPTDSEWNKLVVDTVAMFENQPKADSVEYKQANLNYAKLKYFDSFIAVDSPYIQIDPKYKHKPAIDKYTLQIKSRHYTGNTGFNHKFKESMELASELATTLMDMIPEVDVSGANIVGSRIGKDEFFADAGKIISAIKNNDFEECVKVRHNLFNKNLENVNIEELIDAYIKIADKITKPEQKIYNLNKLYGIKKHLFSPKFSLEIKNLLKKYFLVNIPINYYAYDWDPTNGFGATLLSQKMTNSETGNFMDTVLAMIDHWRKSQSVPFRVENNTITFGNNKELVIAYNTPKDTFKFTVTKGNKETILKYVNEVLMYNPYNHFEDYFNNYYNSKNDDLLIEAWGNILGLVALGVNNELNKIHDGLGDIVDLKPYYPMLKTIGDINALVLNIQSNSVVKNPEGNNLPTSILPNLANKLWEQRMFIKQFELSPFMNQEEISEFIKFALRWGGNPENTHIYANNLIYNGSVKVEELRVRSSVKYKNRVKNPDKLTLSEVLTVSIIDDFWNKLQDDSKNYISLQHATFADKTQHFIIDYDISNSVFDGKSLKELLKDGDIEALEKIIFDVRNKRYTQLATNILNDYRKAFPEETFNSLFDIDTFLKKITLDKLQIAFNKAEIVLQDQIHYIGKKDKLSFNETIINYVTTFSNIKLAKARLNREKLQFIQNLKDEHFTILRDRLKGIDNIWINQYGEMILSKDGKINPILESFFYADALLSNEYTNLLIGDIYSHPSKHKDNNEDSDEEFLLFSEASRLIAQIKRTVIPGATYQPFVQKKDGVSDLINVAIINDFAATVMNIMGIQKSDLDSMDGSGLASPYQVWLENNSLVDGKLNKDRKTIMHGLDPIYGKQMLLKWAVFEISNERRRISYNSDIKCESLFKRMHDRPIINGLNGIIETFIQEWSKINTNNPIYFRHPKSEFVFKLVNLKLEDTDDGKTYLVREIQPVDEHNQPIGNVIYDKLETGVDVKSLYDLDQVVGGAFNYTYDQNLGLLIPSDNNIEIVAKTIVEHNLKNHFIGYLVNKSAIKSGAGNINPDSHFQNEEPFTYLSFPSQFGGVQLDADHSVEYAEVTEMTQLISALIQKGYSRDVVRRIYSDIGETIVSSVKEFNDALNSKQADKVYRILGKALLESFAKGDKDSIGLAKTFVSIAQQFLNEEKIDFKIPFSAATVYPQFISVVTSNLVKSGIRRKYSGLISILVPSHGMIQYYELNGTKYDYTELAKLIKDKGIVHYIRTDKGVRSISIDEARSACFDKKVNYVSALDSALNNANVAMMIDGEIKLVSNPFIVEVNKTDVDFEDTVTVINTSTGEVLYDKQKISNYEQRDEIRNLLSDDYVITKHLLSPKNLKASSLTFEVEGKKYSVWDLDIVRTNHYVRETMTLHKLPESVDPKVIIDLMPDNKKTVAYWALNNNIPTLSDLKNQSFTQYLQAKTQEAIADLKNGVISEQVAFGKVNWDFITKQALLLNNFSPLQLTSPAQAQSYANSIGGINTLRQKKTNKHFGNPFSYTNYAGVQVIVPTVRDSVIAYDEWLRGVNYQEIEPERRKWIIDQIISGNLVGKPLVYYTDIVPDNSYGVEKYHPVFAPNHAHILQKYIYNPGLLVSEIHQQTIEDINKPDNAVKTNPLENYVLHSGGADGADSKWDEIGKEFGLGEARHYYFDRKWQNGTYTSVPNNRIPKLGNIKISESDYQDGRKEATKAAQRNYGYNLPPITDPLLSRDWAQVKYSDAVFAIGEIAQIGEDMGLSHRDVAIAPSVKGGTGYAVGMAILHNKPVHVFDQVKRKWYKWDSQINNFVEEETPVLTRKFAGIGSRKINAIGEQAIREVYEKTLHQTNINVKPKRTFTSDLIKSVYRIINLKTQAAQLAIGKMYASKFLLRTGDKISQITGPEFFKNRLTELYDVDKYRLNDYDYVFFDTDKNPIFVTIASDAEFEQLYSDATLNTDFKNIDGTIYYKDKEFSSHNENISYWKVDSELGPVTMVKLNSIDQLEVLKNNYDLKMPKPNFTNRNFNILFPYIFKDISMEEIVKTLRKYSKVSEETWLKELKNPTNITVNYLNGWIKGKFNVSKTRLAEQMYKSWEIQKKLIGTRIPTQGMQSFMEMEIAIITDSDVNDVYVPAQQTFLQGSDYDIDKLFLLGWEIGDDGVIITGSRLDRFYNPLDVLDLPIPKRRHFELVTRDDADFILTAEHCKILKNKFNQKGHIAILREALLAGPKIKLEDAAKSEEWIANRFVFNLNLHDNTKSSNRVKEQVLKNKVVSGIHKVMSDAENIINATAPIEMEEQQAAAANSTAGRLVKRITSDNPFSKYLMQIQNMVGKEVIGISATGLKAYFALVNFYQNEFDKLTGSIINNDINSVLSILDRVIFTDVLTSNDSNTEVTTIANLNFDKLLKTLIDKNITTLIVPSEHFDYNHLLDSSEFLSNIPDNPDAKLLNIRGLIEFLSERSNRMDAALTHSGFLSAATDNAKELILKKVNADAKFAGVYAYLISTGHSFTEIAEFMKQPIFDEISRLSESNIFIDHTSNFSVDNALDWMLSIKPIVSSWSILAKIVEKAGIKSSGIQTYKEFEDFVFENIDVITNHVVSHFSSIYKSNAGFTDFNFDNQDYYTDDPMYWEPEPEYSEDENGSFKEIEITLTDKHYKDALAYISLLHNKRRILTQSNINALEKLKKMKPFTDEMKLLGKILKINQNIEGKSFEKYNYIRSIEKGINKIIQREFSLIEFLLNETYRNTVINEYDEAIKRGKAQFNILQLIVDSSHFGEMFKLIALDKQLLGSSAIRSRLTDGLANVLEDLTKNPRLAKLTITEYKGLEDFVNDVLTYNYFTNRQDPLIVNVSGKSIKLNSIFGIGEFMKYVNSTIIPNIKKDYPDNDFAKTLTKGRRVNKYTGKSEYFWNLNINFNLRNKNDEINDKFQKVKNAFLEISNNVINSENPDWTLGDILFLYNLFVNKDKFGKNSFSSLFQDMVVNKISPLINDFYNTLAKWDASATIKDFNFNIDDLIFRVIDKNNSIIDQSKFAATIVNNKITVGRYKTILVNDKPKIVVDRELIRSLEYNSEENIFNMPFMNPNAPIKTKPKKKTNVNSNMSTSTFLTNLITHINAMFSSEQELIKTINNQDALDKTNSYNGYIDQGTVYVNVQSPEHLLHELSHVALAIIKNNSPEKYYKLLSNIKQSEMYKTLNTSGVYNYLRGADFLEEVLVKELELYLSGQITNWTNSHEQELETIFSEQPVELLNVLFPDSNSDFQFIIPEMKEALRSMTQSQSELQRILQESQMLLNLKARLFKGYQKNKQQIKLNANCK